MYIYKLKTYISLASLNCLGGEHNGLHGGGADLVNGGGDGGFGETGADGDLTRGVLT